MNALHKTPAQTNCTNGAQTAHKRNKWVPLHTCTYGLYVVGPCVHPHTQLHKRNEHRASKPSERMGPGHPGHWQRPMPVPCRGHSAKLGRMRRTITTKHGRESSQLPARDAAGHWLPHSASPNPSGRPRVALEVQLVAREHGPTAIATLAKLMKSKDPMVSVAACKVLLDRGFGKAAQAIALAVVPSAYEGGPITDAQSAAEVYQRIITGELDPDSVQFNLPAPVRQPEQRAALPAPTAPLAPISTEIKPEPAADPLPVRRQPIPRTPEPTAAPGLADGRAAAEAERLARKEAMHQQIERENAAAREAGRIRSERERLEQAE